MGTVLGFLIRRLFFAVVVLVVITVIDYAMFGDPLSRVFLHLDLGCATSHYGCPPVKEVWSEYWQADVYLLIGGLAVGVVAGITAAVFCAGLIFYSMPAYLFGFGVLLLFEPSFGALPLPFFFHLLDYQATMVDELGADHVRTAEAKGLTRRRVIRHHAGRPAYVTVAALVGVWVPSFITNMVLVEYVFSVPGFFGQTKRALGQVPELPPGFVRASGQHSQ